MDLVVAEKHDIKNIKEIILAAQGLTVDAILSQVDGLDVGDINVIFKNVEPLKKAVTDLNMVGKEGSDLDPAEIKELLVLGVDFVFALLAAIKALKEAKKA